MPATPAYRLHFEDRDGYLLARVDGPEDTFEVSIAYWTEIVAECTARAAKRLLVVENLQGNAVPAEMEQVVEALIGLGLHDLRVAFVDATEDAELLVAAEFRVWQAGLSGRVFRRFDEAEAWLLSEPAADPAIADDGPPAVAMP